MSVLTIVGQVFILFCLVAGMLALYRRKQWKAIRDFIGQQAIILALLITFASVVGSLFLSEAAKLEPCKLCWLARIAMFPMLIIFSVAWWKKDKIAAYYGIILSALGVIITAYNIYLQTFKPASGFCSLSSLGVSCEDVIIQRFGYISIPVMGLTAFIMILLLMLFNLAYQRERRKFIIQ